MYDIPTEHSTAGSILALILVGAPLSALVLGFAIKSRTAGFFIGMITSVVILLVGVVKSIDSAPGKGAEIGAAIFGSMGLVLSLVMALLAAFGRGLAETFKAERAAEALEKERGSS